MPKGIGTRTRTSKHFAAPPVQPADILLHQLVLQAGQNNVERVIAALLEPPQVSAAETTLAELRGLAAGGRRTEVIVRLRRMWAELFGNAPGSPNGKGNGTEIEHFDPSSQTDLQNVPLAYLVDRHGLDEQTANALEEKLGVLYLRQMLDWQPRDFADPWARNRIGQVRAAQLRRIIEEILPTRQARPYLERLNALAGIVVAE